MSLEGKVALITGAGSGIGAACVERFVAEGAKVCMVDLRQDLLGEAARSFDAPSVAICPGDVSLEKDVEHMVEAALALGGRIDVLVNGAGIDPPEADMNIGLWNRILEVNLTGPFLTMEAVIPHMKKAGGGSIVNISSLSALRYIPGRSAYSASKGGLVSLSQAIALEYGPSNIRCNIICPGAIKTPLFETNTRPLANKLGKDSEWLFAKFTSFSPLRRIGSPREIASICAFLASDDSSLLTGNVLMADGGTSIVDVNGAAVRSLLPEREGEE